MDLPKNKPSPEIRKLYPNLTDEQLLQAEETLDRYIEHVLRVYERIQNDPDAYAEFKAIAALHKRAEELEKERDAKEAEEEDGSSLLKG